MCPHRVWMSVIVVLVSLDLRGLLVDGSLGLILPSKGEPAGSVSAEKEMQHFMSLLNNYIIHSHHLSFSVQRVDMGMNVYQKCIRFSVDMLIKICIYKDAV